MSNYWDDELYHYGVLGMRWGVRRGRADKVYSKASKKLKKIDNKVEKYQSKSNKYVQKAEWHRNRLLGSDRKAAKFQKKASRAQYTANRAMKKGLKWMNSMKKELSTTSYSALNESQIALGKGWKNKLDMSMTIRAMSY